MTRAETKIEHLEKRLEMESHERQALSAIIFKKLDYIQERIGKLENHLYLAMGGLAVVYFVAQWIFGPK